MNKKAIIIFNIIAPFCINVGFKGFLLGYSYLRFVKYTGIMGQLISSFALCMGIAAIYLYFWMIWVEGKNRITVGEIIKVAITSSFFYILIVLLLFTYVSIRVYHFPDIAYFSINTLLLLLCLYGQVKLDDKFLKLLKDKGVDDIL